ncbi:MAG: hypothetical protein ABIU63_03195 [Chitinophagaceae bacterium]
MKFTGEILEYLYKISPNGEPTSLNKFLIKKQNIPIKKGEEWRRWQMPFVTRVLNQMHKDGYLIILNYHDFQNNLFDIELPGDKRKNLKDYDIRVQISKKGVDFVRENISYTTSIWNNKTSVANVFATGFIALIVLFISIRGCQREENKYRQEEKEAFQKNQQMQQMQKRELEAGYRLNRIEDSLKIPHH